MSTTFLASYVCSSQQPWAINSTLAYGFAAAKLANIGEYQWCCACYELTFTSGAVVGKKLVVQVTNTGGDLGVSITPQVSRNVNSIH